MLRGFPGAAPAALDAVGGSRLHRFEQALLLVLQLAIVLRTHQQLGSFRIVHSLFKQFVEVRLAIAHADQRGTGAARLNARYRTQTLQPFEAFFLLDRNPMTLRLLAEVRRIATGMLRNTIREGLAELAVRISIPRPSWIRACVRKAAVVNA